MSDLNELVDRYIATWNERDADTRREGVAALWTEDGGYVDPLAAVEGPAAIAAIIAAAEDQFPGYVFQLLGPVDGHPRHRRSGGSWCRPPAVNRWSWDPMWPSLRQTVGCAASTGSWTKCLEPDRRSGRRHLGGPPHRCRHLVRLDGRTRPVRPAATP